MSTSQSVLYKPRATARLFSAIPETNGFDHTRTLLDDEFTDSDAAIRDRRDLSALVGDSRVRYETREADDF